MLASCGRDNIVDAMNDAPAFDPLLTEYEALRRQLDAWTEAWRRRREPGGAAMVGLMSTIVLGDPLASRLEKRLLLAKAHLEGRIAHYTGSIASAIAKLGGDADTSTIARAATEAVSRVGHADDDFGSKLAELVPLVECYRRLRSAL